MKTALLIIDVQKAMDHPKWGERNNPDAEEVMKRMLDWVRSENWPVFHIQDCSSDPSSPYRAGQPLHNFKDEVKPTGGETIIQKTTGNAFYGTELDAVLKAEQISKLVIMGVHTQHCVRATVEAAIENGYEISVLADAVVATAMNGMSADSVQEKILTKFEEMNVKINYLSDFIT
ncbi:isochorismatase family protein [Kordiimonas laminariae]|uniref:isochorismatase family protein n=1 Tax=Kordiimonas laminariae TaxID=2917717 RepID=UPI001FF38104|nr:isochorismatase family protein [Kordiimonas laminariae]MCK0070140.1 isochorismatase family protein [Kordiimonas laminariae]